MMDILFALLFSLSLLSASAQPHQRHTTPTPAVFENERPLHTTALMAGAAWSSSRDAATRTTVPRAKTRPTVGVLMEL
ncbi:hypothetical protein PMIN01_09755 [Paraphaeosphaeria minitans]|uniref:Secreted protein n=1 Tax=Paraphaeosphaeria minitans TaxID=565426 RepID=A0A9P6G9V3_9PLEO|nr:hypothetical protein PMIN01_09755 [Paraphaeosphaeria minitans]